MVSTPQIIGEKPQPAAVDEQSEAGAGPARPERPPATEPPAALDPTRYGDWEKNGRCIDF